MNLYEILQNSDRVGEGMTHFERLFAQKVGGGKINKISGVPPLRYIGDGRPLIDYLISGNAVQDGTPSAEDPVEVQGCGVRTENIAFTGWAEDFVARVDGNTAYIAQIDGRTCLYANAAAGYPNYDTKFLFKTVFKESTVYTLVFEYMRQSSLSKSSTIQVRYTDGTADVTPRYINDGDWHRYIYTTAPGKTVKDICCYYSSGYVYIDTNTFMVVEGSTSPQTYIPYGYKLPFTVNDVEYPIYLGQVETTRRIKKIEVSINRIIALASGYIGAVTEDFIQRALSGRGFCDVLPYGSISVVNSFYVNQRNAVFVLSAGATLEDARELLNGHFVWYVLAEPETGIVNEPLMKIGDYADTVSAEQAGVAIPTVSGANVLDVPTEVKPSEVWIRGRIKEV